MKINLAPFVQGILGGIVGAFLIFLLFLGYFKIMDKISTISLICEKEKIIKSRSIECQILEVKDLGEILKKEDIVSPPPELEREFAKDKKTSGKFIQIKYKIKNERKEEIGDRLFLTLIDKTNREYEPGWDLIYWISEEYQPRQEVPPGLEKEMIEIFEVPKESQEPFKLKMEIFLNKGFFD